VDERVQCAIDTMEEQLHRRLTIAELATAVGLSVAHMTRLFRAATGLTPAVFLHARRMTRARMLLERTSLPVIEVIVQVGLSDRSHFTRNFTRAHGVSPRTLRFRIRNQSRLAAPSSAADV
jgi:AraC-like DNA-binding protein